MLIAKTQQESDLFCEWAEEEIKEVLLSLGKEKHKPYLYIEDGACMVAYKNKAASIPKDMYDFMRSDNRAYEHLSAIFMEAMGFNPRECFDIKTDIQDRCIFLSEGFIEDLIKYGRMSQKEKDTASLFSMIGSCDIAKPTALNIPRVSDLYLLEKEKEVLGVYLSGHPLDLFKEEIEKFKSKGNIRTKKYGTLVLFDRIGDLLNSKYNKAVLAVYCGSVSSIKRKRTTNFLVELSTLEESFSVEDKEFSNSGGLYMNEVSGMEPQNAYFIVVERNRFTQNGIQILEYHKLKSKN